MNNYEVTERNKLKRVPKRAHYDKETVYQILDAAFVCHVSFVVEGQPFLIPTAYGREGDTIYLHGATKSRMLVNLEKGIPVCVAVTHLDGIVVARSAFHSSINYRSVVVFGKAKLVSEDQKNHALEVITNNIIGNRWEEARPPYEKELKGTSVLAIEIESASAKIRVGGPVDEKEDYDLDIWAGVIPLQMTAGEPVADDLLRAEIPIPSSARNFTY
ncbi:pyridoxamine 5'-phosphate oxidase family protein [Fulvivirgaceae bacterium BMA12]|uniref:Pyridoxamine 5'-phosphate oxidase family protein n=1 Tax=Agaribacillus aureus TaxID=3051825 RepID=A0ABT8LHK8_9BACT|nr:pyridoxamine 5'-phosphate oxidase family protein [Fulvivirgaceae bacterium BMA12]